MWATAVRDKVRLAVVLARQLRADARLLTGRLRVCAGMWLSTQVSRLALIRRILKGIPARCSALIARAVRLFAPVCAPVDGWGPQASKDPARGPSYTSGRDRSASRTYVPWGSLPHPNVARGPHTRPRPCPAVCSQEFHFRQ